MSSVSGVPNVSTANSNQLPSESRGAASVATENPGSFIGDLRVSATNKMSEVSATLKGMIHDMQRADQTIARAFFAIGFMYNLWAGPLAFIHGLGIGALSSAASFPFKSETLQNGYLLDDTSETGYAASQVMFYLAALKFVLLGSVIDAMSISIFAGFLAGNSLYHRFKDSHLGAGVHKVSSKLAEITDSFFGKIFYQPRIHNAKM